jgi:hypothetical protein
MSKTVYDLDQQLLSKMIIEEYKNTSGNINEDENITLHIVHPIVMSLLNYGTIKRIVYNIFDLAKKDWAITSCKSKPNVTPTQMSMGGTTSTPSLCGDFTTDAEYTRYIQHLMYLEFRNMTGDGTAGSPSSLASRISSNIGSSRQEGLIGIPGITSTLESNVLYTVHESIERLVSSEKELTRESISYQAGSTLNVTSAIMRTVEKHYNDIFLLWNTYLSIKNHISFSDAKGTIYEFRHAFFQNNWSKIFMIYLKAAVREYITQNYTKSDGTVKFPDVTGTTDVTIETDLATNIPPIPIAPASVAPCSLITTQDANATSDLRKDYHTYKARMMSMENKEETMKQRLKASTVQKFTYLALYLLFLFSMIAFLIIKIPLSVDMKAKITLIICILIIISLTISDLVKMFKGRL